MDTNLILGWVYGIAAQKTQSVTQTNIRQTKQTVVTNNTAVRTA